MNDDVQSRRTDTGEENTADDPSGRRFVFKRLGGEARSQRLGVPVNYSTLDIPQREENSHLFN